MRFGSGGRKFRRTLHFPRRQTARGRHATRRLPLVSQTIKRTPHSARAKARHVHVDHRRLYIVVAEQLLHRPDALLVLTFGVAATGTLTRSPSARCPLPPAEDEGIANSRSSFSIHRCHPFIHRWSPPREVCLPRKVAAWPPHSKSESEVGSTSPFRLDFCSRRCAALAATAFRRPTA
jgi:hypothetical protein